MTENTIYMGVNAPKIHQRIIGQLMMRLGILYYIEKKIPYEPLPETMIDESQTSPTPDILLFDNAKRQNQVKIEVSGNTGAQRVEKVSERSQQVLSSLEEVIVLLAESRLLEIEVTRMNFGRAFSYEQNRLMDQHIERFKKLLEDKRQ